MNSRALALACLLLVAWIAGPAQAALPDPDRVLIAVAERNRDSGRGQPLRLELALFIDDPASGPGPAGAPDPDPEAEALATGVLWSDPDGPVGLELQARAGFVERHLLQGRSLRASRDGALLAAPRPFLPPFPLFQARSSGALASALRGYGVDPTRLGLGYEGASDCYVIGGRDGGPALWIDQLSLDPVRFDRGDGVVWRLAPSVSGAPPDGIPLPGAISVSAPGLPDARLRVRSGGPAQAPPALSPAWLTARPSPAPPGAGPVPPGAEGSPGEPAMAPPGFR